MTEEVLELLVIVAALYCALRLALHWRRQSWAVLPTQQRRLLHWAVGLGVVLVHVTEDVLTRASSRVDAALLSWIHSVMPDALTPLFQAMTLSASAKVVFPLLAIAVAAGAWRALADGCAGRYLRWHVACACRGGGE